MSEDLEQTEKTTDRLNYLEKKMERIISYRNFLDEVVRKKPDEDLSRTLQYFVKALDEILN